MKACFRMRIPSGNEILAMGHMTRARRTKTRRKAAAERMRIHFGAAPPVPPLRIHLVRIAPGRLDDDNLVAGFKATRDGIADWLGVDDGDPLLKWTYDQERGAPGEYKTRVEIETWM